MAPKKVIVRLFSSKQIPLGLISEGRLELLGRFEKNNFEQKLFPLSST